MFFIVFTRYYCRFVSAITAVVGQSWWWLFPFSGPVGPQPPDIPVMLLAHTGGCVKLQHSQAEIYSEASVTSAAPFSRCVFVTPDITLVHIWWWLESSYRGVHCLYYLSGSLQGPWRTRIKNSIGEYLREKRKKQNNKQTNKQNRGVPCNLIIYLSNRTKRYFHVNCESYSSTCRNKLQTQLQPSNK